MIVINGTRIDATEFAYDGCHKIYVVTTQEGRDTLEGYGYDFFPVKNLKTAWDGSCALRFISSADLVHHYIGQFEDETRQITITVMEAAS